MKEKIPVMCPKCGHYWKYHGIKTDYGSVCCPKCKYKYILKTLKRTYKESLDMEDQE